MNNIKKILLLLSVILVIITFDYFRVKTEYNKSLNVIEFNKSYSKYYFYFENIYKDNNNSYRKDHSVEKFTSQVKKDFEKDDFKDTNLDLFVQSYLEIYFEDPFNKTQNYKYYPIYNKKNKIKGYILLSAGIDGEINNDFDFKIYQGDNSFRLYNNNYTFNYLDYYFGKKDILVSYNFKEKNDNGKE